MPLNILYLDDEPMLCEIFADEFSSRDVVISTFTHPDSAVEACNTSKPDLIFIDFRLPGITGDKIAQRLEASIPKFLITGDISVISTYKFAGIFTKPYEKVEIRKLINSYLAIKQAG